MRKVLKAPFNADSIEVSPDLSTVFVGMYEYDESTYVRGGGFLLLDSHGTSLLDKSKEYGCLDAKWISNSSLVIACSDGILRWFSCTDAKISHETAVVPCPSSTKLENVVMTVDTVNDHTTCITSKGQLSILRDQTVIHTWEAHSPVFESWCCGLNPSANLIASGSDDCSLRFWDVRERNMVAIDKRNHKMGTTAVEFLTDVSLLSGSYDEYVREFDLRNLVAPVREFKSIGGIWRLKPFQDMLLVAACYGGCQVLRLPEFETVLQRYEGHGSMAYGIGALGTDIAISCSFYDKAIHIWAF